MNKTMNTFTPTVDSPNISIYWNMLKNLNEDIKLELISKLSASLLASNKKEQAENWASSFSGAWEDSRDAEEIVSDIRNARTSNREIEL